MQQSKLNKNLYAIFRLLDNVIINLSMSIDKKLVRLLTLHIKWQQKNNNKTADFLSKNQFWQKQ